MSHKKAKKIRKLLLSKHYAISAEPYSQDGRTVIGSVGRKRYQMMKNMKGSM